jgi:hypothetical protein
MPPSEPVIVTATGEPAWPPLVARAYTRLALAALLFSAAGLIVAVAVVLYVLWMTLSSPKATPFDSDGVRCYRAADQMVCLKTANP